MFNPVACKDFLGPDLPNLSQMEEFMKEPENPDLAQAFTENLAATASESDSTMSEQDIYQSTVLMQSVVHVKPNNASQAKAIMKVSKPSCAFHQTFQTLQAMHVTL